LSIVGLPDTEVKEARERVRAALQNAGFELPARRITVNLAPADLPKESGRFDLAIALGILAASGQLPEAQLRNYEFAGELSLSGELRPIRGALAMTLAMRGGGRAFILPRANADEAALVEDVCVLPAGSLLEVCAHFAAKDPVSLTRHQASIAPTVESRPDFADVKGQQHIKRALEIAAAGGHSTLLIGPPGAGKTMLATRFAGLLPAMSDDEALEAAAIASLAGGFDPRRWRIRPYRAPHHTASGAALVGGGSPPRPGEISLAHHGVLFLDELPEFSRHVLEVLREPLESGRITISRAARQSDFPARFQLIAAMNACPCGFFGHVSGRCQCTPEAMRRYQGRISGALLDRIDLQVEVAAIDMHALAGAADGDTSARIAARVALAHARQLKRQGVANQALPPAEIDRHCRTDADGKALLQQAMARWHWSGRAFHRILRVARTIADLDGEDAILAAHVMEAMQYRRALHTA
jgi:magnesium chelatase family protein